MENELPITDEVISININVNSHSSIQFNDMFFDPYETSNVKKKAKYIFLTHTHYDHLSEKDIDNVITPKTIIIATPDAKDPLSKYDNEKLFVEVNQKYELDNFSFETLPSYNINKNFHKKENGWVGYKVYFNGITFAVLGDTDKTPELENLKCDILFVPIGGTYTMDKYEATQLTNLIKPNLVIPVHYGSIVGEKKDAVDFVSKLDEQIACKTFF